jgi:hypothetical protein
MSLVLTSNRNNINLSATTTNSLLTAKPSTRQDAKSITNHNSAIQQINDQPDDNSSTLHRDQSGALIPR